VFTFQFSHVDNTNVGFLMSKTICETKFIGDFRGLIEQEGHLFGPVSFPGRALNLACESRA